MVVFVGVGVGGLVCVGVVGLLCVCLLLVDFCVVVFQLRNHLYFLCSWVVYKTPVQKGQQTEKSELPVGEGGGGASCLRSVSVVSLRSGRVQTLWFCTLQPKSASPVASLFESGEIPILENSPYVLQMASSTRRR